MPDAARELAEAGAAYAGQPTGPRPNPAIDGDAQDGAPRARRRRTGGTGSSREDRASGR